MAVASAIGNDLVHIPSFSAAFSDRFKARVYSTEEIGQIEQYRADPRVRYATTWAAKEAVFKALRQLCGQPLGLCWKDIVIFRDGAIPKVMIGKEKFHRFTFSLSLSHDGDYAAAVVIASLDE